jgi:hypothetical protein
VQDISSGRCIMPSRVISSPYWPQTLSNVIGSGVEVGSGTEVLVEVGNGAGVLVEVGNGTGVLVLGLFTDCSG